MILLNYYFSINQLTNEVDNLYCIFEFITKKKVKIHSFLIMQYYDSDNLFRCLSLNNIRELGGKIIRTIENELHPLEKLNYINTVHNYSDQYTIVLIVILNVVILSNKQLHSCRVALAKAYHCHMLFSAGVTL